MYLGVRGRPKLKKIALKPAICTAVMGVAAWAVYGLASKLLTKVVGTGRMGIAVCMILAIGVAVVVYGVLIVFTGAITKEDVKLLPKGDKIVRLLHIK